MSKEKIKEKIISKTPYVEHVFRTINSFGKREVIKLPGGCQVIPYFKNKSGVWKIALVSQYRPALKKTILEAAGGRIEKGETPQETLCRELKEETSISVKSRSIRIVLEEYPLPSILDASMFGGIVKIKASEVKNKKIAGNNHERERTRVEIFKLSDLIKKRQKKKIKFDLMTSRLLDEISKKVKLLIKNY